MRIEEKLIWGVSPVKRNFLYFISIILSFLLSFPSSFLTYILLAEEQLSMVTVVPSVWGKSSRWALWEHKRRGNAHSLYPENTEHAVGWDVILSFARLSPGQGEVFPKCWVGCNAAGSYLELNYWHCRTWTTDLGGKLTCALRGLPGGRFV